MSSSKQVDILVISYAAFRSVNRSVYRLLKNTYNLKVEIIAPKAIEDVTTGNYIFASSALEDERVHFLEVRGSNPRLMSFKTLLKTVAKSNPKVVYLDNDPGSYLAIQLGLWCKLNNSKLICLTCENLPVYPLETLKRRGVKGFLFGIFKLMLLKISTALTDHVFTINNDGTRLYKEYGFASVSKTPLGFDPSIFNISKEARRKIRSELSIQNISVIGYIGRLSPEKGVDVLLEALAGIKDIDWVLIMDQFVAKTKYSALIRKKISDLQLEDRIIYFHADHTEVPAYMNAADIVVIPSVEFPEWVEQYGRVAPEAMACGKLVVASNTGALSELVGDSGVMVPPGNKNQLKDALRELVLNPGKYTGVKTKGYEKAHQELSIHTQAEILHDTYKLLI